MFSWLLKSPPASPACENLPAPNTPSFSMLLAFTASGYQPFHSLLRQAGELRNQACASHAQQQHEKQRQQQQQEQRLLEACKLWVISLDQHGYLGIEKIKTLLVDLNNEPWVKHGCSACLADVCRNLGYTLPARPDESRGALKTRLLETEVNPAMTLLSMVGR